MAGLSVSLLKLIQQTEGAPSESKAKAKEGFNLLLDLNQRSPELSKEKTKAQDPVAALVSAPVFYAPDTAKTIKATLVRTDNEGFEPNAKRDIAPAAPRDEPPVKQPKIAKDEEKPAGANAPMSSADEPAVKNTNNTSPTNDSYDQQEFTTNATDNNAAAANPIQPGDGTPEAPQSVNQIVAQLSRQIEVIITSGNLTNLADTLRAFIAQMKAALSAAAKLAQNSNASAVAVSMAPIADTSAMTVSVKNAISLSAIVPNAQNFQIADATTVSLSAAGPQMVSEFTRQLDALLAQYGTNQADDSLKTSVSELMSKLSKLTEIFFPASNTQNQAIADFTISREMIAQAATQGALVTEVAQSAKPDKPVSLPSAPSFALASEPVKQPGLSSINSNGVAITASSQPASVNASSSDGSLAEQGGEQGGESRQQSMPSLPVSAASSSAGDVSAKAHNAAFSRLLNHEPAKPVLDQVAFHIKTTLKDGSSQITIQLDPVELGKLDIKLNVGADGRTQVVVTADNKDTLSMLQKDSSGLERALSDAGLKADSGSLSFNLRQGQQERDPEYAQASGSYNKTMPEEEEIVPASVIAHSYVVNLAEGLDIKI